MVSAVFHDPTGSLPPLPARPSLAVVPAADAFNGATSAAASTSDAMQIGATYPGEAPATAQKRLKDAAQAAPKALSAPRHAFDWNSLQLRLLPPLVGLGLLVLVWQVVSVLTAGSIPTPAATWQQAVKVFSDPFYRNGPNDQGVGWNVLYSLQRVALGFGMAALVGIPAGFVIGRFTFMGRMFNPLISLMRPVSPLAWLPIGLLVFKGANPAAIWTIFICSIWPMVINTAVGVQRVPQDYLNVARVLNLSEWKVITKILFPAVLPYMLTGVRLAVGTAWLVIVAAEMLTGGVGIGFWVWDEWNSLNVANIIIAIFVIGIVGLLLEMLLVRVASAFTYDEVAS